jgi:large subunit ribosomal protein L29
MKIKEIRNLTNDELNAKLVAIKSELFNLRFQHATGNRANPMLLNSLKKDIAKIKTVLTERELKIDTNSNEKAKA